MVVQEKALEVRLEDPFSTLPFGQPSIYRAGAGQVGVCREPKFIPPVVESNLAGDERAGGQTDVEAFAIEQHRTVLKYGE